MSFPASLYRSTWTIAFACLCMVTRAYADPVVTHLRSPAEMPKTVNAIDWESYQAGSYVVHGQAGHGVTIFLTTGQGGRIGIADEQREFPPHGRQVLSNVPSELPDSLPNIDFAFDRYLTHVGLEIRTIHGLDIPVSLLLFDDEELIWREDCMAGGDFRFFGLRSRIPFNAVHIDVGEGAMDGVLLDNLHYAFLDPFAPLPCELTVPQTVEVQAGQTPVEMSIHKLSPVDMSGFSYVWTTSCPNARFEPSPQVAEPTLIVSTTTPFVGLSCNVQLEIRYEFGSTPLAATVNISDTTPPTLDCPPEVTMSCKTGLGETSPSPVEATDASGMADVSIRSIEENGGAGCPDDPLVRTFVYEAIDASGNTADCEQIIRVQDRTPPEIVSNLLPQALSCQSQLPRVKESGVTARDDCSGEVNVFHVADTYDEGAGCPNSPMTVRRTYRATDSCGNGTDIQQEFTIVDSEPPVFIKTPEDLNLNCRDEIPPPDTGMLDAFDRCGMVDIVHVSDNESAGDGCPSSPLVVKRTYRATDNCGLFVEFTQTMTVVDDKAPLAPTCPPDLAVDCNSTVPPPNPASVIGADDCGEISVRHVNDDMNQGTGCPGKPLVVNRVYESSDACGNTAVCTQRITKETPPDELTVTCPADINVSCESEIPPADASIGAVGGACGEVHLLLEESENGGSGCPADPRVITRTWIAEDRCGRTAQCRQRVTVLDDRPPQFHACGEHLQVACRNEIPPPAPQSWIAIDACGHANIRHVDDHDDGRPGCAGTPALVVRTYEATDACGNTSTCSREFDVVDETHPLVMCPADQLLTCDQQIPVPDTSIVLAEDACGTIEITHMEDALENASCPEVVRRTYAVSDACGHTVQCVQHLLRNDLQEPALTCPPDVTLDPFENNMQATVQFSGAARRASNSVSPEFAGYPSEVRDACSTPVLSFDDETVSTMDCPVARITRRTWTATDGCGNKAVCIQQLKQECAPPPPFSRWGLLLLGICLAGGVRLAIARY